jgi:hypothetical protein
LTSPRSPIKVKEEAVVELKSSIRELNVSRWQAILCLLLALLFLYNPFMTAPSSGLGLNLRHSASHRATVGSSELQQFTATERHAPTIQMDGLIREVLLVKPLVFKRFATLDLEVRSPQNVLPANLWFRPPPAL